MIAGRADISLVRTRAIEIAVRIGGTAGSAPVLFLHGNLSSSVFWCSTIAALEREYYCLAPDLRGFGATEALPVAARTGIDDMARDVFALTERLGLERFHIVGHSMGGGVAMKMLLQQPQSIAGVVLVNPMSPYGYGGSRDERGTPCYADGAPAGAATIDPDFVARLTAGDRSRASAVSPRNVIEQLYFKPPFVPEAMEKLLDGMLATRIGDDWYPGNTTASENWPGWAPGDRGVVNAISRHHFDASGIVDVHPKPPVLWLRGADDVIVSDRGALEIGNQGAVGNIADWPGMASCPPQPMLRQTRAVLSAYQQRGGTVIEHVMADCGHTPFLEKPGAFIRLLLEFLRGNR